MSQARVVGAALSARPATDLLLDQLRGIGAWAVDHRPEDLEMALVDSREARLDRARHRDVVQRQRLALIDWADRRMQASDDRPRAVMVHRNGWFKGRVAAGLASAGIRVVADLENGADAVGVVVAEQPDLLLVEERLPMVSGLEVTRAARRYAPGTLVVAQVESEGQIGSLIDAGATTAYTRRIPPAEVATDLCRLLAV